MKRIKLFLAAFFVAALTLCIGTAGLDTQGKSGLVVVLDAGHGGYDYGASENGLYEKALTLKLAKHCKEELEKYQGVKVYLTRSSDRYVSLDQRVEAASDWKADVFVSLHINSAPTASAQGVEVFYPNSNYRPSVSVKGRRLAEQIRRNLVAMGLKNRGLKVLNSGVSRYADGSAADYYAVIRGSKKAGFPGIIVEHGFLTNMSDVRNFLKNDASLKRMGVADAKGIAACYGLTKSDGPSDGLTKTKLTKLVGKASSSVSLEWEEVKGANGYEIYRSASRDGTYQKIADIDKFSVVSFRDMSVTRGKTYYYKVRPYKISEGKKKTPGFSAAQKVRLLKKPMIAVKAQSASRMKVTWKKVSGATKYEVFRSSSPNGAYQKIATVNGASSYKDIGLKQNAQYYYKVRAVGTGVQGKTYSSYSAVKGKAAK